MTDQNIILQVENDVPEEGILRILGQYFSNDIVGLVYIAESGSPGSEFIDSVYQFIPLNQLGKEFPEVYQFPELLDVRQLLSSNGVVRVSKNDRPLLVKEDSSAISGAQLSKSVELEIPEWYLQY